MLNFNKVYIDPEIYYVENFISQEEIDIILGSTFEWIKTNEDGNAAYPFDEKELDTLKTDGVARRFTGVIKSEEKFWWEVVVKKLRQLLDNENEKYMLWSYEIGLLLRYTQNDTKRQIELYSSNSFKNTWMVKNSKKFFNRIEICIGNASIDSDN